MDEAIAIYRKSVYEAPRDVRLLIFQDSLQLYDVLSSAYLLAIPLAYISHVDEHITHIDVFFKHSDDIKITLPNGHPLLEEVRSVANKKSRFRFTAGQKVLLLTAIVIAVILGLYMLFITIVPSIGLKLISREQEISLGEQMFAGAVGEMTDEHKSEAIQQFADHLKLSEYYPVKVHVVISEEVNAYAVPGGNIVVYSGLLNRMEKPEELVALLGHEVSHVNERHSLRSIFKSISSTIFLSILIGDASAVSGALLTNADKLRGLSYSRSLEKEADEKGLEVMVANKVNVEGMLQMFERLKAEEKKSTTEILSTHPLTDERISNTKKRIQQLPERNFTTDTALVALWNKLKPVEE